MTANSSSDEPSAARWTETLISRLLDDSWEPRLPDFLRAQVDKPGLAKADVRLNAVDLVIDLEAETVTILGLWEEEAELRKATLPLASFWRMVSARAEGREWRSHLPA